MTNKNLTQEELQKYNETTNLRYIEQTETIKKNLSYELENMPFSQIELADKMGLTKGVITNYKNGRRFPNLTTFAILCKELDISADEFLGLKR